MKCDVCGETIKSKRMCDRCAIIIENVIREVGADVWGELPHLKVGGIPLH